MQSTVDNEDVVFQLGSGVKDKDGVDCICGGNTIDKIARKAYLQGYKRALDDYDIKIDEE